MQFRYYILENIIDARYEVFMNKFQLHLEKLEMFANMIFVRKFGFGTVQKYLQFVDLE